MSYVLRPRNLARPELATLVSAVAVVRGINKTTGLGPTIRWPNDVVISGKKLAGVIAQAGSRGNNLEQVVIGIGVNCNTPLAQIQVPKGEVTTIAEELGRNQDIAVLRNSILDSFSTLYDEWKTGADMSKAWRAHLDTLRKQVSIKLKISETPFSCVAKGVNHEGSLVVTRGRTTAVVNAEELEWLREET
jgi:BirA family transcriptional regulator, biotin operon repressor / biotin---[acetyl-CoA-carboxylase] ligase